MSKSPMSKEKFTNQWLRHFAPSVSKDQIEKYVRNGCLWHIFSFDLLPRESFLVGDDARAAYNAVCDEDCIFCDVYGSGVTDKRKDAYWTASSIDEAVTELYVVSKDYSWTYIKTHEELCGPYFMKR